MIFYLEQAGRTPHFSTDLEGIAISHISPPGFGMSITKWLEILEAALRRLQSLSSWPCSDKGNPELILKGLFFFLPKDGRLNS